MNKADSSKVPDVSIGIVSYNSSAMLDQCLESLYTHAAEDTFEILVVDNASSDNSLEMINAKYPDVILLKNKKNYGFSKAVNAAFRASRGKYFFLLNPDARLVEDIFPGMISFFMEHSDAGIVAPKLVFPDGSLHPSARRLIGFLGFLMDVFQIHLYFPGNPIAKKVNYQYWNHASTKSVGWVVGAAFMTKREVFIQCGLMDERFFMYFEDMDYCKTVSKIGYKTYFCPQFTVVHHHAMGGSDKLPVRRVDYYISLYRYILKHKGVGKAAIFRFATILWGIIYLLSRTGMFIVAPDRYSLKERVDIPLRIITFKSYAI